MLFIRARPEGRNHNNLICIVLIIDSEPDVMEKTYYTSKYIHLTNFFVKTVSWAKGLCLNGQLEKFKKNCKNQDLSLYILVSGIARAIIIDILISSFYLDILLSKKNV